MTDPQLALLMLGLFIFIIMLGFPIAFTLMAMGVGFGFYAYFMLGVDADSYKLMGGTEFYGIAQQVVSNAQSSSDAGWKAFEGQTNRYWLIDNQLQAVFRPLRELLYNYHRNGFDQMGKDPANARKAIAASIEKLRTTHQAKPSS